MHNHRDELHRVEVLLNSTRKQWDDLYNLVKQYPSNADYRHALQDMQNAIGHLVLCRAHLYSQK